jgi:hypothetical protein
MRSSRLGLALAAALLASAVASRAAAQQAAQGFAVDRLYASAPGGGWFVMDDLDLHGGFGAIASTTTDYALEPLRVTDGSHHVSVVSDQVITDVGLAATYDRWRVYLNLDAPLLTKGDSCSPTGTCTVGAYQLTPPSFDLGSHPDTLSDARLGVDARLLGDARGAFRLGAGAQLYVPNGNRADYDTDGTFRAMVRLLAAGDRGPLSYAAQVGVHIRPLDDAPAPGSPRGSELLFGVAVGARFPVSPDGAIRIVVGPEVYGETAFRSFFATTATGLEGLVSGRLESTPVHGTKWRVKLGTGGGLNPHFGAPEWRLVVGVEMFDHAPL